MLLEILALSVSMGSSRDKRGGVLQRTLSSRLTAPRSFAAQTSTSRLYRGLSGLSMPTRTAWQEARRGHGETSADRLIGWRRPSAAPGSPGGRKQTPGGSRKLPKRNETKNGGEGGKSINCKVTSITPTYPISHLPYSKSEKANSLPQAPTGWHALRLGLSSKKLKKP